MHERQCENMEAQIKDALNRPVVLVGMMGAGKSHLGRSLAKTLDLPFRDSDKIIEEKAGQSVSDIFESFGEPKFREAERNTILELLEQDLSVIATGGGALTNAVTLEALKSRSIMVWLNADIETLWARVQKSQTRPLLQTDDPKQKLESLMQQRESLYSQAHIHLPLKGQNKEDDLQALTKALYEYINPATVA